MRGPGRKANGPLRPEEERAVGPNGAITGGQSGGASYCGGALPTVWPGGILFGQSSVFG
jgi:hypothetical protein